MSRGKARLGDQTIGVCYDSSHNSPITVGGKIITASENDFANGRGIARLGDSVLTECNHQSYIITASENDFTNGRGIARLGDRVGRGPYQAVIITASENCFAN